MTRPNSAEQIWSFYKQRLNSQPNSQLRNTIAIKHLNLVREIAHRMEDQCAEAYEDLEQIGFEGLMRAIERFNPTKGIAFSSFAVPYIRGEILHFLRDHGTGLKIPRRWRELNASANSVERSWAMRVGRAPTEQEVAEEIGVKIGKLREVRGAIANQKAISLEEKHFDIAEPVSYVARQEYSAKLESAWGQLFRRLNELPPDEQQIVEGVYLKRQSRKEIALQLRLDPVVLRDKLHHALQILGQVG